MGMVTEVSATTRTDHWGKGWSDGDHDCQDTRTELLIKMSKSKIKFKRVSGLYDKATADRGNREIAGKALCNVTQGEWFDPYTGETITRAADLDVDHVVPINHAWEIGASEWPMARRRAYYNDPDNLILVGLSENRRKGDKGPLEYLPPRESFRCDYVKRWEFVKKKWGLPIPHAEAQKIAEVKAQYCKTVER